MSKVMLIPMTCCSVVVCFFLLSLVFVLEVGEPRLFVDIDVDVETLACRQSSNEGKQEKGERKKKKKERGSVETQAGQEE